MRRQLHKDAHNFPHNIATQETQSNTMIENIKSPIMLEYFLIKNTTKIEDCGNHFIKESELEVKDKKLALIRSAKEMVSVTKNSFHTNKHESLRIE